MAGTLFARFALFAVLATPLAVLAVASLPSSALGASPSTMLLGNRQVGSHESHLKPGRPKHSDSGHAHPASRGSWTCTQTGGPQLAPSPSASTATPGVIPVRC